MAESCNANPHAFNGKPRLAPLSFARGRRNDRGRRRVIRVRSAVCSGVACMPARSQAEEARRARAPRGHLHDMA